MNVDEPTVEETIQILQGIRSRYEAHHGLRISDEALVAAANLASRYVSDRYLPDKAIDVVDEAASRVRIYKSGRADDVKKAFRDLQDYQKRREEAFESQRFAEAATIREQEKDLRSQVEQLRLNWQMAESEELAVTAEDVAEIVAMWTGIPVARPGDGRNRAAAAHGGCAAQAHRRPGRGDQHPCQGGASRARRAKG